jgi:hypothetical protein
LAGKLAKLVASASPKPSTLTVGLALNKAART